MRLRALIGKFMLNCERLNSYFKKGYQLSKMKSHGKDVFVSSGCTFTEPNIEFGNDVYVGRNCVFQSSFGLIKIGNHVMFGPGVHIHGGNHIFRDTGRLMTQALPKKAGDDGVVVVEDDCWIGANTIILSNVTIGRGSVIGAGSVVTKDVPPYTVYVGSPACKTWPRFTRDEIEEYEANVKIGGGGS